MKKEKLYWHNETRKVKELIKWEGNPRKLNEQEQRDLTDSLEKFNLMSIPVINTDNTIVSGHQRTYILGLLGRGEEEIDVRVPNRKLTESELKEAVLRENKNTGSWDMEKLKEMDLTMLLDVGFGDDDLQMLFDDVDTIEDDGFNVNRAVRDMKTPRIKRGDIYQLGDHRLMCGDSTDTENVIDLMAGDLADVIYCDPPYNIGLDYNKGTEGSKNLYGGLYTSKKDKKRDSQYAEFVGATLQNAINAAKPNFHAFYWCDEKYIGLFQALFNANNIDNNRVCLWIKNNAFPKPQVAFNKVYEACVYGTRGKPKLNRALNGLNEIMNKEVSTGNQGMEDILDMINLWMVKRDDTQSYEHPTQKPVSLAEKPLKRCSAPGHIVLDLFGGSGSTLLACQQLGRHARLMEIDPIFATVIVDRWEAFTNQKAKKL